VEARAIQAVFKEHASSGSLAFSSTKVWPWSYNQHLHSIGSWV
jgi:hypothetical protein